MESVLAKTVKVKLFAGTELAVEREIGEFLKRQRGTTVLLDIEYNYQGPEFDAEGIYRNPTHGVLLALKDTREG